jgi:hypothetical protein
VLNYPCPGRYKAKFIQFTCPINLFYLIPSFWGQSLSRRCYAVILMIEQSASVMKNEKGIPLDTLKERMITKFVDLA